MDQKRIAIQVQNLGKQYRISRAQDPYLTLQDIIVNAFKAPKKIIRRESLAERFWALKEVTFEVEQGEVVGIIGRNGAGKSTLLKILSRITSPTEGIVEIHGRVGSLLEVGTGFHPELTGRENIYLSGSILGMKRQEIDTKLDDIVKFSGIEQFLDTPVKRYSSGMYVRLAFSVAAHLDTEILLVDEVLAVGDAEFQKKCLGKMSEVAEGGRTVLFVSHNMNAIDHICDRCIYLNNGRVIKDSNEVSSVIKSYLFPESGYYSSVWKNNDNEYWNSIYIPKYFFIGDKFGKIIQMPVKNNDDIWIHIIGDLKELTPSLTIGYCIYSEDNNLLYWSVNTDKDENIIKKLNVGTIHLMSKIPKRFFNEGLYRIELMVSLHFISWICEPGKNSPNIFLNIKGGLSDSAYWIAKRPGLLAPIIEWIIVKDD